jgi:hypothetical protein
MPPIPHVPVPLRPPPVAPTRPPATGPARSRAYPALWALLIALQAFAFALAAAGGWLLPGIDDVAEPRPEVAAALHRAADAARAAAGLAGSAWDEGLARAARQHAAELAERGLLDHASPTPGRHTVGDRLARAGSPYASHGENLAFVPDAYEPVAAAIEGWLASPPHRATLLAPGFDRVGFGTAVDARGGLILVQVAAAAPWVPTAVGATMTDVVATRVSLGIRADAAVTALIEVGGIGRLATLRRGSQSYQVEVSAAGPWPVRIGVPNGLGGYTLEEAGSVAASGRWRPDGAPRRSLRVSGAEAARQRRSLVRLVVEAPGAPAGAALLVDGVHRPEAATSPGRFEIDLTLPDGAAVRLALAEPQGAGRLLLRHGFVLQRDGDDLRWAARP